MTYLPQRTPINSLFGNFHINADSIRADLDIDPNDPQSNYGKYYDYALRLSDGHKSLQKEILQAKDKLDMKYNTQEYIDRKNEAVVRDIAVPLRNQIRDAYLFYLNQGYSQEEAMKKAKHDGGKYREILNAQFKEKFPYSTKNILKNMHQAY